MNALSLAIDVGDHAMVKNLIKNCGANVDSCGNERLQKEFQPVLRCARHRAWNMVEEKFDAKIIEKSRRNS